MKKVFLFIGCWLQVAGSSAQTVSQKLQKAFQQFESDSQLKHAISSLYVIDAATGQVVFDKNSQVGLAPASTQKIITSVTAFELLGKDYRYKTELGYIGKLKNDSLDGVLFIKASGDPTFGSWRYDITRDSFILNELFKALNKHGIKKISGTINYETRRYSEKAIPDGWIWQDIGNYYGAYTDVLNWKENQTELVLKSGSKVGDEVEILTWMNANPKELKSAEKGTGDNAYAYLPINTSPIIAGTIPVNESAFRISITDVYAKDNFFSELGEYLVSKGIKGKYLKARGVGGNLLVEDVKDSFTLITTHYSPSLDSIIYWFNKKSINLYGEALIKTFAYEKQGFGSTDSGVAIVKKFWKDKGLDEDELNIYDGSGLSPLNRVTTHAQVEILKYAKTKTWFPYFLKSLPEYNGMTIKSGTISDVKGFCGYHKAKNGKEYIFSFLVNNYSGKTSGVVNKMYKVLDELK